MNMRSSFTPNRFQAILIICIIALTFAVLILSWVPPVSRDALTHHLAIPKLYVENGGVFEIPWIRFSYYPMNVDLLFMFPLFFGNDIIPKLIHFMFGLLTALLIFQYLSQKLDRTYGLLGVVLFLSLPVIIKLSITVYVDLGLVFFSTAALVYFMKWIENAFKIKWIVLSAIFCGLAMGAKYNGLSVLFLLALFVPFMYSRRRFAIIHSPQSETGSKSHLSTVNPLTIQFRAIGYGLLFVIISMGVFSPWMIRNAIWTGNPVYPLYNKVFIEKESKLESDGEPKSVPWVHFATRKYVFNETPLEIAFIPIRIFFQGRDDSPKYFDGKLNPYLFFLPFFAFFRRGNESRIIRSQKKILLFFAVLYLLIAFLKIDMRIRYIAPIIPPLVILSVFGIRNLWEGARSPVLSGKKIQSVVIISMIILLGMNGLYIFHQFKIVEPFSYLSGNLDRSAYIEKFRPEYAAMEYANRHLPESAVILSAYLGNRGYYSDRKMVFKDRLLFESLKSFKSPSEIKTDLKDLGYTHLLIRFDLFEKQVNVVLTEEQKRRLSLFFKNHTQLLFRKGGYGLFALVDNH